MKQRKQEKKLWEFSETYYVGFEIYNPVVNFFPMIAVHHIDIARRVADTILCPDNPGMDILIVDTDDRIIEVHKDGKKV